MVLRSLSRVSSEAVFALAAFLAPPLAVLVPFGMAVFLPVFGLIAGALLWRRGGFALVPRVPLAFAALLGLWGGVSLLWAPEPGHAASTLVRVLALAGAGGLGLGMARLDVLGRSRLIAGAAAAGLALGVGLIAVDLATGNGISGLLSVFKGGQPVPVEFKSQLSRGATTIAVLFWPFALVAWRGRSLPLAAACLATIVALALSDSLASRLSLAGGGLVFALVLARPHFGLLSLRVAVVAFVAVLPLVAPALPEPPDSFRVLPWLPLSTHHRLIIWHYAGQRMAEHPWRGWGMEAARADPGGSEMLSIPAVNDSGQVVGVIVGARMPLHPHNAALQWWLELGLPGAAILAGFLWWLIAGIERNRLLDRPGRATCAATMVAALAISAVSYGAWQSWWLGVLWLVAAFCLMAGRAPVETAR